MYEYMKNGCCIKGNTYESLLEFCNDIAAHTRKRTVDFRGSKVMHYHSYDERNGVIKMYELDTSTKTGILRFDKEKGMYYVPLTGMVDGRKFIDGNVGFLIAEMRQEEKYQTMFILESGKTKEYMFMGDTSVKTFSSRMPVADFNSSLARDIYMAEKLNNNLDLYTNYYTDGSRSNDIGKTVVRERFIKLSDMETVSKAVAFYTKSACCELEEFDKFAKMLQDVALAHGGINLVGEWTFDQKMLKATFSFNDEKYEGTDLSPAHTFYMSDTGFCQAKVVPTWVLENGGISEIQEDEITIADKGEMNDYRLALTESYGRHVKELKVIRDGNESLVYDDDKELIERIIKTTALDSSQTGIRKPMLKKFQSKMEELLKTSGPVTARDFGMMCANTLLGIKSNSDTSTKRIQEVFSGKMLLFR